MNGKYYTPLKLLTPDMIYMLKWLESMTHQFIYTWHDIQIKISRKYYTPSYLHLTLGLFRSSKSLSICSTGRPEASIDCLFYWSIFPIIYYAYLHTLKLFKSAWNLRLLQWRMKKTWPATFVDMWTARFRSFEQARVCHNTREFKRFPVEKTWRKPFSSAFAQ